MKHPKKKLYLCQRNYQNNHKARLFIESGFVLIYSIMIYSIIFYSIIFYSGLPFGCHLVVIWLSFGCHLVAIWLPTTSLDLGALGKAFGDFFVGGDIVAHDAVVEFLVGHHIEIAGAGQTKYNGLFFAGFFTL